MANVFQYSREELTVFVCSVSKRLRAAESAAAAVSVLEEALKKYTIFDLQRIGGAIRHEVEKLPEPYRGRYRPYSLDPLNQYHAFMAEVRQGKAGGQILDRELWELYWNGAETAVFSEVVSENIPEVGLGTPSGKFFYRLVYGYAMLISGKPGHPVGLPFPGGWTVYEKDGQVFCPIRDKEKDLPQALCNFCPAIQDESCL